MFDLLIWSKALNDWVLSQSNTNLSKREAKKLRKKLQHSGKKVQVVSAKESRFVNDDGGTDIDDTDEDE